jgi:hypothetical protein
LITNERTDRRDVWIVAAVAALVSLAAFLFFYRRGEILLYGDAVAHINIARRVFDSATPGPLQLGTVWLPLPHIMMIPFVVNDWMWRTGVGGSIPSMIAYVVGVVGIFRIVDFAAGKRAAVLAAAIYGLNPNLLYMQSTAMTETIFLAEMIWAVHYLRLFVAAMQGEQGAQEYPAERSVQKCALCLAAAILTRYDGWILAAVCGVIVFWEWRRSALVNLPGYRRLARPVVGFFALCAAVPILWLAQNYAITANALDFLNGPYSAKAIEARSTQPGTPPHPGTGDMITSGIFFTKAAKLNVSGGWLEPILFLLACAGTAYAIWRWRKLGVLLLLWLPLPFYAYSVAYGSVPIFMPVWWPHSYYNVRYGLELLPAFAVFISLAPSATERLSGRQAWAKGIFFAIIALTGASYTLLASQTPICLREAQVNSRSRIALETKLAAILSQLPADSKILMQTGEFVGALQDAGISLSRVVWEGDHPAWDSAMAAPAEHSDYVVAFAGDNVSYAARLFPQHLEKMAEFDTPEKPRVTVYRAQR